MKRIYLHEGWTLESPVLETPFEQICLPCQVHDVLLEHGRIQNPNIKGKNEDTWIGEAVWIYKKLFEISEAEEVWNLRFQGIDTFADILLNGNKIAENKSVYCPLYLENIPVQKGKNILEVHIHPPRDVLEKMILPPQYEDKVPEFCKARVFQSGFHEYSGPKPDLIRMGIYGDVILEKTEKIGFQEVSIRTWLNRQLDAGEIRLDFQYCGFTEKTSLCYELYDEMENLVLEGTLEEQPQLLKLEVPYPVLWYPRTHGEQHLYKIRLCLYDGQERQDLYEKKIGFRRIEQKETLDFWVNGCPVKLWGANLVHPDTVTGCYPKVKEKLYGLLDLAEMGNFNCLRIWGEGEILDEDFYEECDKRGILLWQDFYLGFNMYSEEAEILEMCREEAESLVKRLRHHPSLLLWCGGNEMYWARDIQYPGAYCFGEKIFGEIYPEICRRLDPDRYYHITSPSGGRYANDPLQGDTHGYTHLWFVPGRFYPNFLSENCRVSVPELKTMQRMMSQDELWPKGYSNNCTKQKPLCWPHTWQAHNTNEGALKTGPMEHYFDAETPRELIYRFGAAHSEYIKKQIEQFRRGRPDGDILGKRRTKGHLLWKFNHNSNIISYGVVDYFNEPMMAYYALKRAYEPFQISFSIQDSISVWAVNDTPNAKEGTVKISLWNFGTNQVIQEKMFSFSCMPDEAVLLGNLDSFGQFWKNIVLLAEAYDREGNVLVQNTDYVEIERRLTFPKKGTIKARIRGRELVLSTDVFARSVELKGEADGDSFGWIFEDNYFDLVPGREKRVYIHGKHAAGRITIQPYYWEEGTEIFFSCE